VAGGQGPLANRQLEKSQALYEGLLAADPASDRVAAELAQLLWEKHDNEWTVLKPAEMKSRGGVTLTLQSDGSILASGRNPERDTYTIVAPGSMERIRAIRLETLPDPSLPKNGPGRISNGNFGLAQFRVFAGDVPVALSEAAFD